VEGAGGGVARLSLWKREGVKPGLGGITPGARSAHRAARRASQYSNGSGSSLQGGPDSPPIRANRIVKGKLAEGIILPRFPRLSPA
jgi:hypothetical protein